MNKNPELLAPAGSIDAAWAALTYGADAVYAGLPRFSARAEAVNFSEEQLDELIGYAHAHDRKVYITFNTLVQQHELSDALQALARISDLNADGLIVQDMGVVRMAKRFFPKLPLHASTQMAIHNLDGAKLLADLGFTRVVLARELSLKEIETITRGCGIETEVFIHGALCYSYSGLCLFSSHLLGRSGNRGRCAYCCRQTFSQGRQDGGEPPVPPASSGHNPYRSHPAGSKILPFSMKDFAVGPHLDQLLDAGVTSLKIEGRMKGPEYVGGVTDFYRKRLNHEINEQQQQQLLSDIQTIFGRPATDLYLKNADTNPIDPTTNGHRGAVIGTIQSIVPEQGSHWLHFHTDRALQKFDGLKIELPGKEPYGFSATEIRLQDDRKKHLKFEIPAHADIAVKLPTDHPYLESGLTIYCSISQTVRQRYKFEAPRPGVYRQRKPFNATVELSANGLNLVAEVSERQRDAFGASTRPITAQLRLEEPLSKARNPEKTEASIRKCFEKTGGTEWQLDHLEVNDNGLFLQASLLNEARRKLLEKLSAAFAEHKTAAHAERLQELVFSGRDGCPQPSEEEAAEWGHSALPTDEERWSVKLRDLSLLDQLTDDERAQINEIVLETNNVDEASCFDMPPRPNDDNEAECFVYSKRLAIPVIQRESPFQVSGLKFQVSNIGALYAFRHAADLTADWPLYTLNSEAAAQWKELGIQQNVLSPEDTRDNLKALIGLLGDRAIVPVYQHTPLMISATRPDCGETLTDRDKRSMRIEQNGNPYILIDEAPFSLIEHLGELRAAGARNFRIDLTYGVHTPADAARILRSAFAGKPIAGSHDGNYRRTL
ncbi:MAG: U32 family peptidase [Lentisphaerae bacterium]|nr:U32 family peptidase [Lentisphaerota bacterium]